MAISKMTICICHHGSKHYNTIWSQIATLMRLSLMLQFSNYTDCGNEHNSASRRRSLPLEEQQLSLVTKTKFEQKNGTLIFNKSQNFTS
jgi:hypothetical protein